MRPILSVFCLALALVGAVTSAPAQTNYSPATYSLARVHWQAPGDTVPQVVSGRLTLMTPDSLSLTVPNGRGFRIRTFNTAEVMRLDTGVRRTALAGGARGALIASLVAAPIIGMAAAIAGGGDEGLNGGELFVFGAVYGAIIAFPVGGLWGSLRPGVRWMPVPLAPTAATLSP